MADGYVSQVQLPNNETYDIKDKNAVKDITSSDIPGNINFTKGEETKDILVKDFGTAYGIDCYKGKFPLDFTSPGGAIDEWKIYGNSSGPTEVLETQSVLPTTITAHSGNAVDWEIYGNNNPVVENKTGDLPIEVSATEGNVVDWTIYGNDDNGTENLFDYSQGCDWASGSNGVSNQKIIAQQGDVFTVTSSSALYALVRGYTANDVIIRGSEWSTGGTSTYTAPASIAYVKVVFRNFEYSRITAEQKATINEIMLVKGSTAPDHFIPYQQGVGERTENLFDYTTVSWRTHEGQSVQKIPVTVGAKYYVTRTSELYALARYYKSDDTSSASSGWLSASGEITIPADTVYVRMFFRNSSYGTLTEAEKATVGEAMFTAGSTAPTTYIPYGYQIPLDIWHKTKNLVDITGFDRMLYGVRWYEDNGQLRASGTYTDSAAHTQPRFYAELNAGTYTMSGAPNSELAGAYLQIGTCTDEQGSNFSSLGSDTGTGYTFTLQEGSWVSIRVVTTASLYQQTVDLTLPIMLRLADTSSDFEPYYLTNHADIYIGNSPLTQGQSITKAQSGQDVALFSGDNIIDTTLVNKPQIDLTYQSSVLGVGENTEVTGELPIDFRSNGDDLLGYKIYGTAEGAGVQTENLWDESWVNGIYSSVGAYTSNPSAIASDPNKPIPVQGGTTYYIKQFKNVSKIEVFFYSSATGGFISYDTIDPNVSNSFVTPQTAAYMRFDCYRVYGNVYTNDIVISTAFPTAYVPYGYKIPLSLASGTESKTADVYIGDSKLLSDDYIDYESGKIVRNNTPQDPPLPLPPIETFNGENTIDSTVEVGETMITQGYRIPLQIQQGATTKTADIYIGSSPLTEGQSVTKASSGTDIALYQGNNTISTTLGNKPEMRIDYLSTVVGVGERTENLANVPNQTLTISNDYYKNVLLTSSIEAGTYTLVYDVVTSAEPFRMSIGVGVESYTKDISFLSNLSSGTIIRTFTISNEDAGRNLFFRPVRYETQQTLTVTLSNVMLVKGSTPPSTYIPYGYQIPVDIKQDDEVVDHKDIYIGTQPLIEGDYINQTGVYRRLHQFVNYASSSSLPNYNFIPITEQLIAENGENTITTSLVNNTTIDVELHPTKQASWICDRLEDLQRRIDNVDSTLGAPERRNYLVTWCSEDRLTGSTANLDFSFNNKDSGYSTFLIDGKSTATSAFTETINLLHMINGTIQYDGSNNYTVARPGKYVIVIFGVEMEDSSSNNITLKIIRDNAVIASQQLVNEYIGCIPFEIPNDIFGNNTIIQIEVNSTTGWTDLSFGVGIAVLNATMLLQDSNLKTDTMAIGNFSMYDSYVQLLRSHRSLESKCTILENKCTVLENEYDQLANESVKDIIVYSDYTSTIPSGLSIDISQYKNKIKYVDIYFTDNNYRKGEVYPYNILAENFGYLRIPYGQIYTGASADEATRLSLSLIGDENSYYIRRELFYVSTDYEQEHLFFSQYSSVPGLILQFVGTPTNEWSDFSVKGKASEVIKIYEVHLIVSP